MNFVHLNGKVEGNIQKSDDKNSNYDSFLQVRVQRNFIDIRNDDENFLINVFLWKGVKKSVKNKLQTKSNIIVHGRIETLKDSFCVVAEQIEII